MFPRIVLASAIALITGPALATSYTLESNYTQGVLRWDHLGFSHPAAQFSQAEGTLEFDRTDPGHDSVQVSIPLSSLATGVAELDEELRSPVFFNAGEFPTATFKSTHVEKGAMPDRLKVAGELTMHGVTRPLTLDVSIIKIGTNPRSSLPTVGFEGTATIKRSDFGLGRFVPQVSDAIELRLSAQAVETKAYTLSLEKEAAEEAAKAAAGKK